MIYVAALVVVVVCIPLMHDSKRPHAPQTWLPGAMRPNSSVLG